MMAGVTAETSSFSFLYAEITLEHIMSADNWKDFHEHLIDLFIHLHRISGEKKLKCSPDLAGFELGAVGL